MQVISSCVYYAWHIMPPKIVWHGFVLFSFIFFFKVFFPENSTLRIFNEIFKLFLFWSILIYVLIYKASFQKSLAAFMLTTELRTLPCQTKILNWFYKKKCNSGYLKKKILKNLIKLLVSNFLKLIFWWNLFILPTLNSKLIIIILELRKFFQNAQYKIINVKITVC